jgi:hypothetical protein
MAKGLSTKGLARLHVVMAGHVERGAMPGLITLVARHGDVHVDVMVEEGTLQLDAPVDDLLPELAEEELQLRSLGPPWPPTPHSPDTWIRRLGTLPLMYQPGEQWLYNTGARHRRWLPLVDRPAPTCRSSTGWISPTSALEDVSRSRPPLAGLIIRVQELAQPQGQAPTADAPAQAVTQPPEQRDLRVEARTPRG